MTADALGTMFMAMGDERAVGTARGMRDSVKVYFILAPESGSAAEGDFEIFSTLDDNE